MPSRPEGASLPSAPGTTGFVAQSGPPTEATFCRCGVVSEGGVSQWIEQNLSESWTWPMRACAGQADAAGGQKKRTQVSIALQMVLQLENVEYQIKEAAN